jgi:hypothetical protein
VFDPLRQDKEFWNQGTIDPLKGLMGRPSQPRATISLLGVHEDKFLRVIMHTLNFRVT